MCMLVLRIKATSYKTAAASMLVFRRPLPSPPPDFFLREGVVCTQATTNSHRNFNQAKYTCPKVKRREEGF